MDFDFTTHLSKLLSIPTSQITIQALTGGLLNAAVRASFNPPVDLTRFGHPESVRSVILKYSPPYMVNKPSVPLDTIRQDIEARALVLLDPNSEESSALPVSSLFTKYPKVKTPRLIHHDSEKRVLIMADLGSSVVTIGNWLTQEPAPLPEDVERIAKDLGCFLGEFVIATSKPSVELLSLLQLPSNSALVNQLDVFTVDNMKVVLQGVPDVDVLTKRVEDAARDFRKTNSCLGMVDLWRRNIVIDSDKNICLLDWELFGWSNASWEMSLLGVLFLFIYFSISKQPFYLFIFPRTVHSMHWILLKSSFTDAAKNRTNVFLSTMLQNYGRVRADVPSPHFRRQALIFYGREIINLLKWNADEFKFDDKMREKALELGLVCLRAAGASVDTMDISIFDSENAVTPYERVYEKARSVLAAR
jgi:hypothetical protein